MNSRALLLLLLGLFTALLVTTPGYAAWGDTYYWKSDATSANWDQNWWNATAGANQNPGANPGGGKLQFDNQAYLNMTNNWTGSAANRWQIYFLAPTWSRTVYGTTENTFYDNGGSYPKIENNSTNLHAIHFPIKLGYNPLEVNPVNGSLTLGGNINLQANDLHLWGDLSKTLTLSGVVSGTGKIINKAYNIIHISGASTFTGNIEIDEGEVWIAQNATLGAGNIYVGNGGSVNNWCKLWITDSDGGTTVSRALYTNYGSTSGLRSIGALNPSGINAYNGALALSGDCELNAFNSGGAVAFGGAISGTNAIKLTGAGTVHLNATSTLTGPTLVTAGTLAGTGSVASSAVTINSGARIAPGTTSSIGYFKTGNLTMNAGSRYSWNYSNTTSEWIGASALALAGGATHSVTVNVSRTEFVTYPVTRTLFTYSSFTTTQTNALWLDLSDVAGDNLQPPTITVANNTIMVTLVPEPAGLLALAGVLLALRRAAQ
jgi:autotransporter-associated beta strand protein